MMVERARVMAVDADSCWVETLGRAGCAACAAGQGCGGGVIAGLLGDRRSHLRLGIPAEMRPAVNDVVEIGVLEQSMLRASALAYMLPLAGIVAGAVLGERMSVAGSDALSMAGAAAGFLCAMTAARVLARSPRSRIGEPVLLRILPAGQCTA